MSSVAAKGNTRRPVVQARERHVGRADHHRDLPVSEADEPGMMAPEHQ